jgi:hypothetical protein
MENCEQERKRLLETENDYLNQAADMQYGTRVSNVDYMNPFMKRT